MIAAVDVHYTAGAATGAAVVFSDFSSATAQRTYTRRVPGAEDYVPGQLYRRELPCILAVLAAIEEDVDTIVIDGYVQLGERPGLGMHLWEALGRRKNVIGVAKRRFKGAGAVEVSRPGSKRALYVTAAGIDARSAAELISRMPGDHRLPTLLKLADSLSRQAQEVDA